ncbi:hypothetical protein ACLK2H_03465 [Escherichia coli]
MARYLTLKCLIIALLSPMALDFTTHTLATGPVNDLELALFPDEDGGLSLEILANQQRYDKAILQQTYRPFVRAFTAVRRQSRAQLR